MRKLTLNLILTTSLMCAVSSAFAIGDGFYLGIMLGPATNSGASSGKTIEAQIPNGARLADGSLSTCINGGGNFCTTRVKPRSQQFAARIYLGNQFNPYAGIELGGTFFSQIHYNTQGVQTTTRPSSRVRSLDLSLKGMLPVWKLTAFGKAGVAVTYLTTSGSLNPDFTLVNPADPKLSRFCTVTSPECEVHYGETDHENKFSGIIAFGFSYDIDQNWQTDVAANVLLLGGNIGRVTFYTLGISYHFVNKYCGQFLCDD